MAKMKLVDKLHQKTVLDRLRGIDWAFGSKGPYVVELDPTTACDLACPGCISGALLNQKDPYDKRFSDDRLLQITDELIAGGVKAVILIGGGEPLSHPKVGQVIDRLGRNDVQVGITTNGTFIDRHLEVIAAHSQWTRVSMDSARDETFKYLRPSLGGKSKFRHVVANMEKLAKVKKGVLGFSFLLRTAADGMAPHAAGGDKFGKILQTNVHEIYEGARLAKEIGCDYFEPKPSYDDDHNLVLHSAADMQVAREQIERARELEDDDFHILESINLEAALTREPIGQQAKGYKTCPVAEMRTLVTPSGVYVCPYFRGREDMKLGDLREQTLHEMWSGSRRKAVMDRLDPSCHCSSMHCIRHETNLELFKIIRRIKDKEPVAAASPVVEDRFI